MEKNKIILEENENQDFVVIKKIKASESLNNDVANPQKF